MSKKLRECYVNIKKIELDVIHNASTNINEEITIDNYLSDVNRGECFSDYTKKQFDSLPDNPSDLQDISHAKEAEVLTVKESEDVILVEEMQNDFAGNEGLMVFQVEDNFGVEFMLDEDNEIQGQHEFHLGNDMISDNFQIMNEETLLRTCRSPDLFSDSSSDGTSNDIMKQTIDAMPDVSANTVTDINEHPFLNKPGDLMQDISDDRNGKLPAVKEKKVCPVCNKTISSHVARHLSMHGLSRDEIKNTAFNLRKRRHTKRFAYRRKCPFPECSSQEEYSRLDKHLIFKHKLERSSEQYKKLIRSYTTGRTRIKKLPQHFTRSSEEISGKYSAYLQSMDGGSLSSVNARQQYLKLRQMLTGMAIGSANQITTDEGIKKLEEWLSAYITTHEPSSGVTYICVFISFLKYLAISDRSKVGFLTQSVYRLNKWKKSLAKKGRHSINAKDEISTSDVCMFERSEVYRSTISLINDSAKGYVPTAFEHADIRNTLMLSIFFRNSCRSCGLYNIRVCDFLAATETVDPLSQNTCFIINVLQHKTVAEHGPQKVVLTSPLRSLVKRYFENIRPCFINNSGDTQNDSTDSLFVTSGGRSIDSSDVYSGINSIWKKAGFSSKIGSSLIRKTATTLVHSQVTEEKDYREVVARHLCHRFSTAEKHYKMRTKDSRCIQASNVITSVLRGEILDVPSSSVADSSITEMDPSIRGLKGRCFFDEREREIIADAFADFIFHKKVPTMKEIKCAIQDIPTLKQLDKKCVPLKIKGAVLNFVNKQKKKNL